MTLPHQGFPELAPGGVEECEWTVRGEGPVGQAGVALLPQPGLQLCPVQQAHQAHLPFCHVVAGQAGQLRPVAAGRHLRQVPHRGVRRLQGAQHCWRVELQVFTL